MHGPASRSIYRIPLHSHQPGFGKRCGWLWDGRVEWDAQAQSKRSCRGLDRCSIRRHGPSVQCSCGGSPPLLVRACAACDPHASFVRKVFLAPKISTDSGNAIRSTCESPIPRVCLRMGVVRSRWASWSSKPVAGRVAGRGGFDSHPLPPLDDGLLAMILPPSIVRLVFFERVYRWLFLKPKS